MARRSCSLLSGLAELGTRSLNMNVAQQSFLLRSEKKLLIVTMYLEQHWA